MNFLLEARIMIQTRREELLLKSIQFQAKAITEEILRFIQTAQTEVSEILSRKHIQALSSKTLTMLKRC